MTKDNMQNDKDKKNVKLVIHDHLNNKLNLHDPLFHYEYKIEENLQLEIFD